MSGRGWTAAEVDGLLQGFARVLEAVLCEETTRRRAERDMFAGNWSRWHGYSAGPADVDAARDALVELVCNVDHERGLRLIREVGEAMRAGRRRGDEHYEAIPTRDDTDAGTGVDR